MCVATLALGTLLVVHTGCDYEITKKPPKTEEQPANSSTTIDTQDVVDQAQKIADEKHAKAIKDALENYSESPESVRKTREAVHTVLQGMTAELQKKFDDETTLYRAQGKLADLKTKRADLKKLADDLYVKSETPLMRVKREEETKQTLEADFKVLQEIAKKAGLPKFDDASDDDKAKEIRVNTNTYTGAEVYRRLSEYKTQMDNADVTITIKREDSQVYKALMEATRSMMNQTDKTIVAYEREIERLRARGEIIVASESIKSVLSSDDINGIDNMLAELQKKGDEAAIKVKTIIQENTTRDIGNDVQKATRASERKITDDDLI